MTSFLAGLGLYSTEFFIDLRILEYTTWPVLHCHRRLSGDRETRHKMSKASWQLSRPVVLS